MTAKALPREGHGNFRLYATVRHQGRAYELEEGPYRFRTKRDALRWLAAQRHVQVLRVSLYHREELIAMADENGPVDIGPWAGEAS